jgi:hypothetical protein
MAKSFLKLKDPKLGMLDKITFGKLQDCRVCDVIEDHYNYLIWAEQQGYVKFQQTVIDAIQEHAGFEHSQPALEIDEVDVHLKKQIFGNYVLDEDDVPF